MGGMLQLDLQYCRYVCELLLRLGNLSILTLFIVAAYHIEIVGVVDGKYLSITLV